MKLTKNNCLFLFCLLLVFQSASADDDDPVAPAGQSNPQQIVISGTTQGQAGIQTAVLKAASHRTEFTATGRGVNLQALLSLRNRYLLSIAENQSAKAKLNHSSQNLQRLQNLYENGVTAKRNLQAQQTQQQTEQALVDTAQIQSQAIKDEALLSWGGTLTDWALSSNGKAIQPFLSGQQALVLVSLPAGKSLPDSKQQIYLDASGNRSHALPAKFISSAPQPDTLLQGEHYFFQTNGAKVKPGMKIVAWLPEQQKQAGVLIPKSAVVWYMDQAFVFIQSDSNKFTRLAITDYANTPDGYFVGAGLEAGQVIVISGAQLLLSEEIRGQIPDD